MPFRIYLWMPHVTIRGYTQYRGRYRWRPQNWELFLKGIYQRTCITTCKQPAIVRAEVLCWHVWICLLGVSRGCVCVNGVLNICCSSGVRWTVTRFSTEGRQSSLNVFSILTRTKRSLPFHWHRNRCMWVFLKEIVNPKMSVLRKRRNHEV